MTTYIVPHMFNGLGNRLFMYSCAYGIAKKNNKQLLLAAVECEDTEHQTVSYDYFFGAPSDQQMPQSIFYYLPDSHYLYNLQEGNEELEEEKSYIMRGFYLAYSPWQDYASDIRNAFGCPHNVAEHLRAKYPVDQAAFMHIRRGDFLKVFAFNLDLSTYRAECIRRVCAQFPDVTFLICSDDIQWCREADWPGIDKSNVIFVQEDEVMSLWVMSLCARGGICANSTYSWWAGFLNESDAPVYFPTEITVRCKVGCEMIAPRFTVVDVHTGKDSDPFTDPHAQRMSPDELNKILLKG